MSRQRTLSFENLEQAIRDIEHLLTVGYQQHGAWNLSQCCGHLDNWLSYPIDGFPKPGAVMGSILWLMKKTMGKSQLNAILSSGFKPGTPTMPASVPAADSVTDQTAFESLKQTVQRFDQHSGVLHPSPLFGNLDKETATRLQLRHFEHHLGFFTPSS